MSINKMKRPPTHPGEILQEEFLTPMEISQAKLAKHLGWTPAKLNEIIKGKRGVTAETAIAFSQVFGTTAEFWLNLQTRYDLWQALQSADYYSKITLVSALNSDLEIRINRVKKARGQRIKNTTKKAYG